MGAAECISDVLTTDPKRTDSYFREDRVKVSILLLELLYCSFFAFFGLSVLRLLDIVEIRRGRQVARDTEAKR